MANNNKSLVEEYNSRHSRDEVIQCPHMMALLGYLQLKHNLPKYGWQKDGLRYHYTDAAGLLGIIQSGRLWGTDIRFLNDPSEGTFFLDRIIALMNSKPGGTSQIEREIIKGLKEALHNPRSDYATYCVSLSANGDLLSQWRGYGSFGNGYAVGLRLDHSFPHAQIAHYYDVVYGDSGLEDLALDLIDLFQSAFDKWKGMMYDDWAYTLSVLAKSFKDLSYSEEEESRLVCTCSGKPDDRFQKELPLNFRTKGSDLIPYIPVHCKMIDGVNL